jgi:hypothetical protein
MGPNPLRALKERFRRKLKPAGLKSTSRFGRKNKKTPRLKFGKGL